MADDVRARHRPRRRGRPPKNARPPGTPTTKESIVVAAAQAFAERGVEGASLAAIAESADVTTGAVYSHFTGKPELLLTVVDSTLVAIAPQRDEGVEVGPEYLHAWIDWLLHDDQAQVRSLIAEINHVGVRDADVRAALMTYTAGYADMISELVRGWQRRGEIATDRRPDVIARIFLAQATGLCAASALEPSTATSGALRAVLHDQLDALLGT